MHIDILNISQTTVDGCEILHQLMAKSHYWEGFKHPLGGAGFRCPIQSMMILMAPVVDFLWDHLHIFALVGTPPGARGTWGVLAILLCILRTAKKLGIAMGQKETVPCRYRKRCGKHMTGEKDVENHLDMVDLSTSRNVNLSTSRSIAFRSCSTDLAAWRASDLRKPVALDSWFSARISKWGFPARHGDTPKYGLFIVENPPINGWWVGVTLWLRTPPCLVDFELDPVGKINNHHKQVQVHGPPTADGQIQSTNPHDMQCWSTQKQCQTINRIPSQLVSCHFLFFVHSHGSAIR